ncbi:MAG: hypothetical protein IKZ46_17260 [Victivallales bacterium]|nr:hypothetical protein [Victivallales bacterium]
MKHYTKEELELYRHHEMSVLRRVACSAHLKECTACTSLLKELDTDDAFVMELRDSIRIFDEAAKRDMGK